MCRRGVAQFNLEAHFRIWNGTTNYPGSDGNSENGELDLNRDMSACHELGHSIGFGHHWVDSGYFNQNSPDCLRNDWLEPEVNGAWRDYNGDHRAHINGYISSTPNSGWDLDDDD